jgi:D-glycero-D-manno-heptose 1,7-bisphosphate phosphatase
MGVEQPAQAVVLVGGLGTRLGAETADMPKPLVSVAGRPFLEHLIEEVARHGLRRVLLLARFQADKIARFAATSPVVARFGLRVETAVEPEGAGTGGALWHARDRLDRLFLLLNGDSWADCNLLDLAVTAGPGDDWLAAMAVREVPDGARFGTVEMDGEHVLSFRERPDRPGPALVNAGIYLCRKGLLDCVAPACSLERDVLPKLAGAGQLKGRCVDGYFVDIGIPAALERARVELPGARQRRAVFFDRDGVLNTDHGHVGSVDRFEWIEGAREAVKLVNDRGWLAFVVTNQAGVARGYYDEAAVAALHAHMQSELMAVGAHIDDFRYCPHHPAARIAGYAAASSWRKPAPGMILDLLEHWPVDPAGSFLIGDKESDLAAATAAGLEGFRFTRGRLDRFTQDCMRSNGLAARRLHEAGAADDL